MNEIIITGLCRHCGAGLTSTVVMVLGHKNIVPNECDCQKAEREAREKEKIRQGIDIIRKLRRKSSGIYRRQEGQTLGSFIPRAGQQEAHERAKLFISELCADPHTKGMLFVGAVGSGKTHLAASIANRVIDLSEISDRTAIKAAELYDIAYEAEFNRRVQFISMIGLLGAIKKTFDTNETAQDIVDRYSKAELLILDDVGTETPTEWSNERLFEIIDYRYNEELPTVITTNLLPDKLRENVGDRSYDRIREMCHMVKITANSQRVTA